MKRIRFWCRSLLAATALMTMIPAAASAQEEGGVTLPLVPEADEPDLRLTPPRWAVMTDLERTFNKVYDENFIVLPDRTNEVLWSGTPYFNSPTGSYLPLVTGFRF